MEKIYVIAKWTTKGIEEKILDGTSPSGDARVKNPTGGYDGIGFVTYKKGEWFRNHNDAIEEVKRLATNKVLNLMAQNKKIRKIYEQLTGEVMPEKPIRAKLKEKM